jgi:hypothetical protein
MPLKNTKTSVAHLFTLIWGLFVEGKGASATGHVTQPPEPLAKLTLSNFDPGKTSKCNCRGAHPHQRNPQKII